jgi:hypothetical protein
MSFTVLNKPVMKARIMDHDGTLERIHDSRAPHVTVSETANRHDRACELRINHVSGSTIPK